MIKLLRKIGEYIWAFIFLAAISWWLISSTDIYQEIIHPDQWAAEQQNRAQRAEENKARFERIKDLDSIECHIMLRAKAQLLPVEIERSTLFGISRESAEKRLMKEFELDSELCEKYGISSSQSGIDARDDCERYPGPYGC